jgi:Na+-transporting NADH:ubiquinone oxidoreductase subunit B
VLKKFLDKQRPLFEQHGKLAHFQPIFEALDSFLYTSGQVAPSAPHVRDGLNIKKTMGLVVIALIPCTLAGLYNTGLQANLALAHGGLTDLAGWRFDLLRAAGLGFTPHSIGANVLHGFLYFFPVLLVSFLVGGFWEVVFSCLRNQEIHEGFLVTGLIFPLILPPTIPLWLVALGISFGVVIGKLIFGGTGRNFLNPALTGYAFLFFSYPATLTGERVWATTVDGITGATPLGRAAVEGVASLNVTWGQAFLGFIPGSMGETSTFACLLGAALLLSAGIASWRIMLSICIGMVSLALLFNFNPSATNPMFAVTPVWHFVLGGFAFGTVFMATDPVTSAVTTKGQWLYGLLIGVMAVLIRVLNPGFPEGMMLAILFGNCLAPFIDYLVVQRNMQRRLARHGSL